MRAGPWGLGFTCSTHVLTGKTPVLPTPTPNTATASQTHADPKPFPWICARGSLWPPEPPNGPVCWRMCGSLKIPICCACSSQRGRNLSPRMHVEHSYHRFGGKTSGNKFSLKNGKIRKEMFLKSAVLIRYLPGPIRYPTAPTPSRRRQGSGGLVPVNTELLFVGIGLRCSWPLTSQPAGWTKDH